MIFFLNFIYPITRIDLAIQKSNITHENKYNYRKVFDVLQDQFYSQAHTYIPTNGQGKFYMKATISELVKFPIKRELMIFGFQNV